MRWLAVLALAALAAGCAGSPPDGWRFVDVDHSCSECDTVLGRTKGADAMDASLSADVAANHYLWATYFEQPPHARDRTLVLSWTATAPATEGAFVRLGFVTEPADGIAPVDADALRCRLDGGNATEVDAALWRVTLRPGQGTCEAEVAISRDLHSHDFADIDWFVDGPLHLRFTARQA